MPAASQVRPRIERTRAARRAGDGGHRAGSAQHADSGAQVLRLEIAVEQVGQQDHLARRGRLGSGSSQSWKASARKRQQAGGGKAEQPFAQPARAGQPMRAHWPVLAGWRRRAPSAADAAISRSQRHAVRLLRVDACQHLDLHPRHVDAGRAFAPAGLAGDTERHRLAHLVRRPCAFRARDWPEQGQAQRVVPARASGAVRRRVARKEGHITLARQASGRCRCCCTSPPPQQNPPRVVGPVEGRGAGHRRPISPAGSGTANGHPSAARRTIGGG